MRNFATVLGLASLLIMAAGSSASARLLPRTDLTEGFSLGFQPDNAQVAWTSGKLSVGLDVSRTVFPSPATYRATNFFDPAVSLAYTAVSTEPIKLGLIGLVETTTGYAAPTPGRQIDFAAHKLGWELGLGATVAHRFLTDPEHWIRLYVAPYVSVTQVSDGSLDLGRNSGFEGGVSFNDGLDLLLSNSPLIQLTVVGVRGHM